PLGDRDRVAAHPRIDVDEPFAHDLHAEVAVAPEARPPPLAGDLPSERRVAQAWTEPLRRATRADELRVDEGVPRVEEHQRVPLEPDGRERAPPLAEAALGGAPVRGDLADGGDAVALRVGGAATLARDLRPVARGDAVAARAHRREIAPRV